MFLNVLWLSFKFIIVLEFNVWSFVYVLFNFSLWMMFIFLFFGLMKCNCMCMGNLFYFFLVKWKGGLFIFIMLFGW